MAEYWKSLPRKYCDICKCWFADNKSSIEFHEKGKNHQENVKKRIDEIQKKGLKDFKAKKKMDDQMAKIEKAALEAFKKDIQQNPELAAKYNVTIPKVEVKVPEKSIKSNPSKGASTANCTIINDKKKSTEGVWFEAKTEEGYSYYWNSVTSESIWEPPKEGYVSLEEQNVNSLPVESSVTEISEKDNTDDVPENAFGPQMKPDPYGAWVPVEKKPEEIVDLQLPARSESVTEVYIPLTKDDTLKMKEKTVGHLSEEFGAVESTFKKRKHLGSAKRNMRQRTEDG